MPSDRSDALNSGVPKWTALEQDVRDLLGMQGWRVSPEQLVGHKKVDGLIEKTVEFGERVTYALECKDYSRAMTKNEVVEIVADYMPILQQGKANRLLIVTSNGLAPSAHTYCSEQHNIIHMRYVELLNHLLSFQTYVNGLVSDFESDYVSRYYIEQGYRDASDHERVTLEDDILRWIDKEGEPPLAVLAGYGMGKTTLARRLAYLLAKRFRRDPHQRIPIIIKLEGITSDQSLEGLLGKHFTSQAIIPNYNFHIFMKLNRMGRFVIFLDGFDEMKRTMSSDSMRYNFQQLNRLTGEKTKIVLLGRPTAFLTEQEYWESLHGKRVIAGVTRPIPDWPDYREIRLLPFNITKVGEFIRRYTQALNLQSGKELDFLALTSRRGREKDVSSRLLVDIAQRPVQLKMLMEVLPHYKGPLDGLTTTVLYSEFIDLVIRREMEKASRLAFSLEDRRRFASDLAFWVWSEKIGSEFTVDRVPGSLFEPYTVVDEKSPEEAIRRDLLSACFLEKKPPGGYYFPHRSFLEYLVAERIANSIRKNAGSVLNLSYVTPELAQFFVEMMSEWDIQRWHKHLLEKGLTPSEDHIRLFAAACKRYSLRVTKSELNRLRSERRSEAETRPIADYISRTTLPPKSPHKLSGVTKKKHFRNAKGQARGGEREER